MKKKYNVLLYVIAGDKNYSKFSLKAHKRGIHLLAATRLVHVDHKHKKVVSFPLKDFASFNQELKLLFAFCFKLSS